MAQFISVSRCPSPLLPGFTRISATAKFERTKPQVIWFDVPSQFEQYLSDRGEPWLLLLFPCAIVEHEDIELDLAVDPVLLYNLTGIQRVWQSWYKWVTPISVKTPQTLANDAGRDTALFFSGGVDSYFSLLAHSKSDKVTSDKTPTLLMVWGFDISLDNAEEFAKARKMGERVAKQFDTQFIPIATNLKELGAFSEWWGELSHGAALAAIAHLLSNKFEQVIIGATHDYAHLSPWGSHPLVDLQFSSSHTIITHHGAASTRVEKMARLCAAPEVAGALRVCWEGQGASNCSRCSKCLRTMVTFDLLNAKHLAASFDWSDYNLNSVANVFLKHESDVLFALEIREAANEYGRSDIATAIDRSLKRSRSKRGVRAVSHRLSRTPILWRFAGPLWRAFRQ